jgi:nucleoside-diphosphate-sugar epimerase
MVLKGWLMNENRLASGGSRKHALVVGATGVVGRHIASELGPEWEISGLARKFPDGYLAQVEQLQTDLADVASVCNSVRAAGHFTHVFYCAYAPAADWNSATALNAAMFSNVLAQVADAEHLERVVLVTGTKVYGSHLGPVLTPILEIDPRHPPPNFYFDQADALVSAQRGRPWTWSELRPHTLCGVSPGTPMSLATILAVYGAVCAELGIAMRFPGSQCAYEVLYQVTDAALFGRAAKWAATEPTAGNEAFNITNGEGFRWKRLWPSVAKSLGVEAGPPASFSLREFMADKATIWDAIVAKYKLQSHPMDQLANWQFADYVLANEWDIFSSTTKARQHGFAEVAETAAMFERLFGQMRDEAIIPAT